MVLYGQIIIGAPGAGKTTYCDGMQQYLKLLGRDCHVVNLDPANEVPPPPPPPSTTTTTTTTATSDDDDGNGDRGDATATARTGNTQLPYETILDVCEDVISLDSVMSELNLGPNGG